MRSRGNIPVPGRHFAFVEVVTRIKYHTVLLDGSELGAEARVREMLDRGDTALAVQTVSRELVDVRIRPVQIKHLEHRTTRVIVHEHPRDPFLWACSVDGGLPIGGYPDIGMAIKGARAVHGNDADISIQAEGYPGDTPVALPQNPATVLGDMMRRMAEETGRELVPDFEERIAELERHCDELVGPGEA